MIYVVAPGDTLSGIARLSGSSVAQLQQDNGILPDQPLVPGQALVVPDRDGTASEKPLLSVGGYAYPHIRSGVLQQALPFLTTLSIFSYGFREDGTLVEPPARWLLQPAGEVGAGAVLVLTSTDEDGNFSSQRAAQLFRDRVLQTQVLDSLLQVLIEKGYVGLDADFEYIPETDRDAFFAFLDNARERLHQYGFFLQVDLAPKTYAQQPGLLYVAHDYAVIGSIADTVLLMTYEWGYAYGPPMAIAPLPQVEAVVRYAVTEIPTWKIQLGIPNYGYDWTLPYEPGRRAVTLGNEEAVRLAAQVGAEIQFDPVSQAPTFQYQTAGTIHQVWFEDARSVQAKFDLIERNQLVGGTYWNLLRPFPQNWALAAQRITPRSLWQGSLQSP